MIYNRPVRLIEFKKNGRERRFLLTSIKNSRDGFIYSMEEITSTSFNPTNEFTLDELKKEIGVEIEETLNQYMEER